MRPFGTAPPTVFHGGYARRSLAFTSLVASSVASLLIQMQPATPTRSEAPPFAGDRERPEERELDRYAVELLGFPQQIQIVDGPDSRKNIREPLS